MLQFIKERLDIDWVDKSESRCENNETLPS